MSTPTALCGCHMPAADVNSRHDCCCGGGWPAAITWRSPSSTFNSRFSSCVKGEGRLLGSRHAETVDNDMRIHSSPLKAIFEREHT